MKETHGKQRDSPSPTTRRQADASVNTFHFKAFIQHKYNIKKIRIGVSYKHNIQETNKQIFCDQHGYKLILEHQSELS